MLTDQERAELVAEIEDFMEGYNRAFASGTRADLEAMVNLPVIYVAEEEAQVREKYPFDPEKMRAATGFHHPETTTTIVHLESTRAHLQIEGTRHRADGSVIESIDSFYILHKGDDGWKVSVFSGIRGARA